jgi:serine protease Do
MLSGRVASSAQGESAQLTARGPEGLSSTFADVAKRVESAVVNIDTKMTGQEMAAIDNENEEKIPQDLLELFRQRMNRPRFGVGSGFIIDAEGYVLTNRHVVKDAARITVRLQSGEEFRGEVIGSDEETDLAVVKVKTTRSLPVVRFGDSNAVQVGDWVLAIGSPFGLEQTVTAGIISKLQRESPQFSSFQQFLQTDAAINRGNSGGPLVNMRGEVIGINSQIATTTGDYNGIGFALPSNDAAIVYQRIRAEGKVRRGYLGINPESVRNEYARVYGLSEAKGAIVANITDTTGPAAKAGIEAGDIIIEINGQQVQNAQDLIIKIAVTPVGQMIPVVVLREVNDKFERKTFNVTLGERPPVLASVDDETPSRTDAKRPTNLKLGLTLSEITPQIATTNNLKDVRGVIIKEVDPNGIAADIKQSNGRKAFNQNDVITHINRVRVTSLADFDKVVRSLKEGDAVVVKVVNYDRGGNRLVQRVIQFTYQ